MHLNVDVMWLDAPSSCHIDFSSTMKNLTENTMVALDKFILQKVAVAILVHESEKLFPAQDVRYTPSQQGLAFHTGVKQRVIQNVEMQKYPIESPIFKV